MTQIEGDAGLGPQLERTDLFEPSPDISDERGKCIATNGLVVRFLILRKEKFYVAQLFFDSFDALVDSGRNADEPVESVDICSAGVLRNTFRFPV